MDSKETSFLKKLKLTIGKKLNTLFIGEYHSAFKGFGLAFDSVREYQYGDDIRSIDWNVSARMNHLYVKQFVEERELSIVIAIDISGSVYYGNGKTKRDVIIQVAALFLYLAQMNNDRVSVLLFTDRVEKFIRPRKGRKFIMKVLDDILKCEPTGKGTDISASVDFLRQVLKKRSIVIVLSDFLDNKENYLFRLKLLSRKHDIIPVQVSDPHEKEAMHAGLSEFADLETGEVFMSDIVPEKFSYPALSELDIISLSTDAPIEMPILQYFEKRNRTKLTAERQ